MIGVDTTYLVAYEDKSHKLHAGVVTQLQGWIRRGELLALTPQVVAEFLHVATDTARFPTALTMKQAVARARWWRAAREIRWISPDERAVDQYLSWIEQYRLGRKRMLDTLLAATFATNSVYRIATLNPDDFTVFEDFEIVTTD